ELRAPRVMASLTDDLPRLTDALLQVPLLSVNIAVVLSSLLYLAWLSATAMLIVLGFMVLGFLTYQFQILKPRQSFRLAREEADALFQHFRMLIEGIKNLQLHYRRRQAFLDQLLGKTARAVCDQNVKGMTTYTAAASWGQTLAFVVVGLVIFGLPALRIGDAHTMSGYALAILYMISPLQVAMNIAPNLGRANVALKKLEDLGLSLNQPARLEGQDTAPDRAPAMNRLELINVMRRYASEGEDHAFVLGPISLSLNSGEIVFLAGGNGSGKTTLAKLLTGLYSPDSGEIRLNDDLITEANIEYYRQHFSAVFSDFFLTSAFLGLDSSGIKTKAHEYLKRLELTHKVQVTDAGLSTVDLSQGQRKRLALLTAFLEDRQIYVFDEWAADQDQMFKDIFYCSILPEL